MRAPSRAHEGGPAATVGFWSALLTAASAISFLIGALLSAVLVPAHTWTGDAARYAESFTPGPMIVTVVPSLVIAPSFLVLVVAIHSWAPPERKHWSLVAVGGAAVYAAVVMTNYYLQLTLVRPSIEAGRAADVALLIMDNPQGAFWPIELLAYGIQGLAAGADATVFRRPGLERAIRWSFGAVGASGVLSLVAGVRGADYTDPIFIAGGALWGIALPVGAVLCAILFRRTRWAT